MTTTERIRVLDESGKVRAWLDAGRGVRVWESREIGITRPIVFTPGDTTEVPPHWGYRGGMIALVRDAAELLFYAPLHIIRSWPDSSQGTRACLKALDTYKDEVREAPIGRVYTTYTMRAFTLGSVELRSDVDGGPRLVMVNIPPSGAMTSQPPRLMHVEFRVGIQSWSAIEPATESGA